MDTYIQATLASAVLLSLPVLVFPQSILNKQQSNSEDKYFEQLSENDLLSCNLEKGVNNWCSLTPHALWPSNKPIPRQNHATAIYSRTANETKTISKMLLFGGQHLSSNEDSGSDYSQLRDTWIYCPIIYGWTKVDFPRFPARRQGHSLTTLCDTRVILYGGSYNATVQVTLNDTWLFNGVTETWIEVRTTVAGGESFVAKAPFASFAVSDQASSSNCSCTESLFVITKGFYAYEDLQFWLLRCMNDERLDHGIVEYHWERISPASTWLPVKPTLLLGAYVDRKIRGVSLVGTFDRPCSNGTSSLNSISLWYYNLSALQWKCKEDISYMQLGGGVQGYYSNLNALVLTNGPRVLALDLNTSREQAVVTHFPKDGIIHTAIHEQFMAASASVCENDLLVYGGRSGVRSIYPADQNVWRLKAHSKINSTLSVEWKRDGSSPTVPDIWNRAATYITMRSKLIFFSGGYSDFGFSEGPSALLDLKEFVWKLSSIYYAAVWILDFKSYRWWRYQTEDFPRAIPSTASVVSYEDYVLFCGGFVSKQYQTTNELWLFDEKSRIWVKAVARPGEPNLPSPRALASFVSLQNFSFLYFGGVTKSWNNTEFMEFNDLWLLTITTTEMKGVTQFQQNWEKVISTGESWPPKRYAHSAFFSASVNSMYIFGGSERNSCSSDVIWKFSLNTYNWSRHKILNSSFSPGENYLCQYQAILLGRRMVVADSEAFDTQCGKLLRKFKDLQSVRETVKMYCSKFRGLWTLNFEEMKWTRLTKYQNPGLRFQLFFPWKDRVVTIITKQTEERGLSTSMWSFKPGCFAGYYSPNFTTTPCSTCLKGTYSSSAGSKKCSPCPKGMTTETQGSTSFASCNCITDYCGHGQCIPVSNRNFVICHCDAGFTGSQCQTPTYYLIGFGALSVAILVGIFSGCLAVCWRRRKKQEVVLKTVLGTLEETEERLNTEQEAWTVDPKQLAIGDVIGSGGSGVVYRGDYCGSIVAIKKLKAEIFDFMKDDVTKEFDMMKRVRHKNIVQFIGAVLLEEDVVPAFVVEYMEKGSLRDILDDVNIHIDYVRKLFFALDAAKGMNYLHCLDPPWIHRDLKTANLLVDENWCVKVGDFGCALLLRSGKNKKNAKFDETFDGDDDDDYVQDKDNTPLIPLCPKDPLMHSSYSFGTSLWKAPEAVQKKGYGTSADVYSFGIVLWEIFTRRLPYEEFRERYRFMCDLMDDIVCGQRPIIPKNCPQNYGRLMKTCWDTNSEARPTFQSIKDCLRNLLSVKGIATNDSLVSGRSSGGTSM